MTYIVCSAVDPHFLQYFQVRAVNNHSQVLLLTIGIE